MLARSPSLAVSRLWRFPMGSGVDVPLAGCAGPPGPDGDRTRSAVVRGRESFRTTSPQGIGAVLCGVPVVETRKIP